MKQTWSIGERLFKDDYRRRMKMFNALVGSVMLYGAEVWGWRNEERIDGTKRKYAKWILGLDRRTPNYILVEETKMEELRTEALKRAIKYEEHTRKAKKKKLVMECIREMDRRRRSEESKWETKRREALERIGVERVELERKREELEVKEIVREIMEGAKRKEEEERRGKILISNYNSVYIDIMTEEIPGYLRGKKKRKDRVTIARYRCGNEMKGGQHWRKAEERVCRVCKKVEENITHVIRDCEDTKNEITLKEFLSEDGRGLEVMKRIDSIREVKGKEDAAIGEEEKRPISDEADN